MRKTYIIFILIFISEPVFTQNYFVDTLLIQLTQPVDFAFIPNTTNVFITRKGGDIYIYDYNTGSLVSLFWKFEDSLNSNSENGLLGVCLDPNYANNHFVYFFYTHAFPPNSNQNLQTRIVRFTENSNIGSNPLILASIPETMVTIHVGGILRFRPSQPDKLYFFLGEHGGGGNAQNLQSPFGKMMRINKNGTIPADNPFYDDGNPLTGNDDRIWSYGHRNSFGFCFGPNDSLYETENGANFFDEANIVIKGKNYGWPFCEGYCNPYNTSFKQPMVVFTPLGGLPAVTGILYYTGVQMPWLTGKLLIASNNTNTVSALYQCDFNSAKDSIVSKSIMLNLKSLTTLLQGADGFIYALLGGYTSNGKLFRIRPDLTGINNQNTPVGYLLNQNYPNPFNPQTNINYEIPKNGFVTLKIYNAIGSELSTLVNESKPQGSYEVTWDASNFPSGVYFYELTTGEFKERKKMVLIK